MAIMEEHRVIMQDGTSMYVKVLGAANKDKPVIIASHGGPGVESHTESQNSFGFLSEHFRVIVYDMRGSGNSVSKGPYTHQQYVDDVEEIRQWAAVDQFIAAGASYGGIVSLEYILAHPDRVTCLLLRNTVAAGLHLTLGGFRALLTSPRVKADHGLLERVWSGNARDAEELIEVLGDLGTLFKPEFTANGERREPPPRGQMSPEKLNVDVWNCSASYNIPRYDVRSRLPSIGVPTMVVGGTQDIITTVRHVEEIAEGIPKAELFILEGAGHNLPDDERELWNQTVWNFLKTHQFCD